VLYSKCTGLNACCRDDTAAYFIWFY